MKKKFFMLFMLVFSGIVFSEKWVSLGEISFQCPENVELDAVGSSDEQQYRELFFSYWTLKESFVKCTGQGLGCPFCSFSFTKDRNTYKIKNRPKYKFITFSDVEKIGDSQARSAYAVCLEAKSIPNYSVEYIDIWS